MSKTRNKFSPEVRKRAVSMVGEHRADYGSEWEAMTSIASKIGTSGAGQSAWHRPPDRGGFPSAHRPCGTALRLARVIS